MHGVLYYLLVLPCMTVKLGIIDTEERGKLKAFEMWCYRKTLKVKQIERMTNEKALIRIKKKRELQYSVESEEIK